MKLASPRSDLVLALVVTALGAGLRLFNLASPSLWIDEIYSITDSWNALDGATHHAAPKYPVSYYCVLGGLRWFGWNEIGARIIPCVFGILAPPVTFLWLARRGGTASATIAAGFLALSSWHVFLSQNARYYTLMVLAALALFWCTERWITTARGWWSLGALAAFLAALRTHPSAGLCILPIPLYFVVSRVRLGHFPAVCKTRHFKLVLLLVTLLATIFAGDLLNTLQPHFTSKAGFHLGLLTKSLVWHSGAILLLLALGGTLLAWRDRDAFFLFVACVVWGILGAAAIASFWARVNQQYVVAVLPFLCALCAYFTRAVARRSGPLIATVVAATLLVEMSTSLFYYFGPYHGYRADWRAAAAHVIEHVEPGDLVVSNGAPIVEFYMHPENRDLRDGRMIPGISRWNWELLYDLLQRTGRTWYIIEESELEEWYYPDPQSLRAFLKDRCTLEREFPLTLGGKHTSIKVYLQRLP